MAREGNSRTAWVEPVWWALFSAGGFVAAFLVPVHLFVNGIAAPLGWVPPEMVSYERMRSLAVHPLVRLYLAVLIALPLFHWAHRFLFTVKDMGLARLSKPLAVLCYGSAVAGGVWTFWILLHLS